jgi:hypothetical protein
MTQWREKGGEASEAVPAESAIPPSVRPFFSNVLIPEVVVTGRDRELASLEEAWGRGTKVVEVVGPPGVGKWNLVTHRLQRRRANTSVFVWDFASDGSYQRFFRALLDWFGDRGDASRSFSDSSEMVMGKLRQERILRVLREPMRTVGLALPTSSEFVLRRLGRSAGMTVMTSRSPVGTEGGVTLELELGGVDEPQADVWQALRRALERYRDADVQAPLWLAVLGVEDPRPAAPTNTLLGFISEVFGSDPSASYFSGWHRTYPRCLVKAKSGMERSTSGRRRSPKRIACLSNRSCGSAGTARYQATRSQRKRTHMFF